MLDQNKKELCKYRIEKAYDCLKTAKLLIEAKDYTSSANRSYYAMFHAIRAIMALDGEDRKKHSGVVSYFQENYIKTGVFSKEYSYYVKNAFQIRQESDYEDFCIISEEDVTEQFEQAELLIMVIERYVNDKIN